MAALAISFTPSRDLHISSLSGRPMKPLEQSPANFSPMKLSLGIIRPKKSNITKSERRLIVRAGYSDGGRQGGSSIFIGAFVLGGIIVGTLGCVYAPQISRALAGADKKDLMRKLPKFIYDEEKALEKTRKVLAEKIKQLNSAIDDVSSQLQTDDDGVDGVSVPSVDEATV